MNNVNQSKNIQIEALEQLNVHDHICSIYETKEEQFSAIVPFIKIGLERGEKCIYVVNDNTVHEVQVAMQMGGIDTDSALKSGSLSILNRKEYFLKQGPFEPDWMIQFLKETTDSAKSEGFCALRLTTEMTWFFGVEQGIQRLIEFESKINSLFLGNDIVAICQYNRRHFTPEFILNAIRTHPIIICGSLVCKNFYYVPPDEYLKPEQTSLEIDRLLNNIRTHEQKESELKENEEMLRKLTSSTFDAIIMMNDKGEITYWNEAAEKMFGYPKEEVIGKNLHKLIVPERFYENYFRGLKEFKKGGTGGLIGKIIPMYGLKKDGTEILAEHSFASTNIKGKWQAISVIRDITERKEAEEDLKLYINLINQSNDAIFVLNSETSRILNANEEAYKSLGYEREELLNLKVTDITSIPDRKLLDIFEKIRMVGSMVLEAEHKRKDGTTFPVEVNAKAVTFNEKSYMIAVARDITERKSVEIHEKRIIFTANFSRSCRDFIELQPVTELATKGLAEQLNVQRASVWLLDDSNNLVCQKLYEHPKGSFSEGTVLSGASYPDYIKAILNDIPVDAHNARTDPRTKEFLNDYLIPLNICSMLDTPIKLKGKISGVLCLEHTGYMRYWQKDEIDFANTITAQLSSAIDRITERKRVENALSQSREQMQSILDNTTAVIYLKDTQGKFILINLQFQDLFHITKEEIVGKTDYDIFPKEIADEFQANDRKVLKAQVPLEMEEVALHDDGPHTYISIKFPLFDSNGIPYGVCGISTDITERKRIEDKLRKLSHAIEQSSSTVVITDTKGNIEYANPRFTQLTGYTHEEAIGKNPRILKSGKTSPEVYKELWKTITSGNEWRGELCNRKKSGELYWESVSISPVKDEKGVITNFIAVKDDTTERKQIDEELKESELRYRQLFEDSPIAIWEEDFSELKTYLDKLKEEDVQDFCKYFEKNPNALRTCAQKVKVLDVNKAALELYQAKSKEKLLGNLNKTFTEKSFEVFKDEIIAIVNGADRFEAEAEVQTLTGKIRYIYLRFHLGLMKDGNLDYSRALVVTNDITELKLVEESLRKNQSQFLALTNVSSSIIYHTDARGKAMYVSKRWAEFSGLPDDKWKGDGWANAIHPDDREEVFQSWQEALAKRQIFQKEFRFQHTDGTTIWLLGGAEPILDNKGNLEGYVGIATNITERKKVEVLLNEQKRTLEQKNIALNEVLGQIEIEKKQIKDNVIANAENLLLPVIQRLMLNGESRKYVQLLQENIQELTSSFGTKLTEVKAKLTSREIEICNMIKNGLTNKEIAGLVNISQGTIERHRANIRKKLGLIKKDINLSSFLKTL